MNLGSPARAQSVGNPRPAVGPMNNQDHSGDELDEEVAAQMSSLVGHVSSAIQEVRTSHMAELRKVFQQKLIKSLKDAQAQVNV